MTRNDLWLAREFAYDIYFHHNRKYTKDMKQNENGMQE